MTGNQHIVIATSEFPPQPGGIGNHAYNLALYLDKAGYEVNVVADQRSELGHEEQLFDGSLPFSVSRIKRYSWRFKMYISRIYLTFRHIKKESIVIATGKFSLWNVSFLRLFFHRKTIAIVHGTEVNFKSAILKKSVNASLKRMDHIIAVSKYTKSLITHLKRDVEVIPNGINISRWNTDNFDKTKIKGSPALTTVGRVSSRKGQLNVIKHLSHLIEQFPDIHYHCVGIPSEAQEFSDIAKELGVEAYITFHGSVTDDRLKQILNASDIFVMLSSESKTGDVEGFGIAILEANALSIPAIGSKGCGIEDAIYDYNSGILISVTDSEAFKNAIAYILDKRDHFKSKSKEWAMKHDWSVVIESYVKILNRE